MSSTEANPYAPHSEPLLTTAQESIRHGLQHGKSRAIDTAAYPLLLREPRASFVTLHRLGELRGCIGNLEPARSLIVDVGENAFSAAFRDPRFPPLDNTELDGLDIHISILGPLEPLACRNDLELIQRITPFQDGIVLRDQHRRGTFLPSVWTSLPDPRDFVRHLKHKAGMPEGYWSATLEVFRYSVYDISA